MPRGRPKGYKKTGGKPKGYTDQSVKDLRLFIKSFCEKNASLMQELLEKTAVRNPAAALSLLMEAFEFSLPKLSRTELTGGTEENDKPIELIIRKVE